MKDDLLYIDCLKKLQSRTDLEPDEADHLCQTIFEQKLSQIQIAALLVALAAKGEAVSEIVGFVQAMRRCALRLNHHEPDLVDTAGTGGDAAGTFNISTTAAFVIAGAGVPVAKHGNRAISSRCGSADVLASLGVKIDATTDIVEHCLANCGITFLFAPAFHQGMKIVAQVRKELGIRTIFNLLGPLLNPAGARRQIIGVYSAHLTDVFAEVLKQLGCQHALVFSGEDGLDEITVCSRTRLSEIKDGVIRTSFLDPESFGFEKRAPHLLRGGDSEENAQILLKILEIPLNDARNEIVLLNAAAGIYVSGRADSFETGLKMARLSLEGGQALKKLQGLIAVSNGRAA